MGVTVREKKKGSGVYWVFVKGNGKRTSKRVGSRKLANQVAEKLRAQLTLGDNAPFEENEPELSVPTFKEYATHWLEDYIHPLRRDKTYVKYRGILNKYLFPEIGHKPLDAIKRIHVRNILLKYHKQGLSRSSVVGMRDVISGVMNYAIDEDFIESNPVKGVIRNLQIARNKKNRSEPFTKDEIDKILQTAKDNYPDQYLYLLCAFRTGMRMGELSGLQWRDIDLHNRRITVQRSFRDGKVSPTKTDKIRYVDMSNQLFKELHAAMTGGSFPYPTPGQMEDAIGPESASFIFSQNGNPPVRQNSVRFIWKSILNKANIRYRKFHDIRHTFASLLLSQGASPVFVKEQLGHSSIQITVDIYGHWIRSESSKKIVDGPGQLK